MGVEGMEDFLPLSGTLSIKTSQQQKKGLHLCRGCLFFTVQQRLVSPDLLHNEKLQEWIKRNGLHKKKHPEVK